MDTVMDVQDTSQQNNSQVNHENSLHTKIWVSINDTILKLFATLEKDEELISSNEACLQHFLVSLLSHFNNLNILAPPINQKISQDVEQQYDAFTTWLFGAMFYLVNLPVTSTSLKQIVDIQVCMLRILSRLHLGTLQTITSEYLSILDDLIIFCKNNSVNRMILEKFVVKSGAIDNVDLQSFTVKVTNDNVSIFQISILKIIADSDVSCWPKDKLHKHLLNILIDTEPMVKLVGLQVCTEVISKNLMDHNDLESIVLYALEVIKCLPYWLDKGLIPLNSCQEYTNTFRQLIISVDDPVYFNLFFEIFSLAAKHILRSNNLEIEICKKIEHHLDKHPKLYETTSIETCLFYFANCPNFTNIIVCFIVHEIENCSTEITTDNFAKSCDLWKSLKDLFNKYLKHEKYEELLNFFKLTKVLDFRLVQQQKTIKLLDGEIPRIFSTFLNTLSTNNYKQNKLVFENFVQLISLQEVDKDEIQNILSLPWLDVTSIKVFNFTKIQLANAKSLDFATKVKCLNAIGMHGKGQHRLDIFNMSISNCEIELGVASIMNCPILLLDKNIKFDEIVQHILVPAYNTQKCPLLEALASTLGKLACFTSGSGLIIRDSSDPSNWTVQCEYCDKVKFENTHCPKVVSSTFDTYFCSFFEIFNSTNKKVRLNISKNIIRFSNHIPSFNGNALVQKWIPYIQDNEEEVRLNLSRSIQFILTNRISTSFPNKKLIDLIPQDLEDFIKMITDQLIIAQTNALETGNHSLHETVLLTAKNAACIPSHLTEKICAGLFIVTVLHVKSSNLSIALATDAYAEVAFYHKTSLKTLYIRYKKDFLKIMVTLAVHNRINYDYNMATSIHRMAKCLGYQGSRQLLRKDGHHAICLLLPQMVKYEKAKFLLQDIAELVNIKEKDMCRMYFQHICCQVFLFEDQDTGMEIFKFVSQITDTKVSILTGECITLIINELMLHFHAQKDKILQQLQFMAKFDSQNLINMDSVKGIAKYLNPMLHGILVTFDANLNINSEEFMQKCALASLAELIKFMGATYVAPYNYKILTTLRTALGLTRPGFRKLACEAWDSFLRNTSINDIGPLLATICISLVPLLETYPRQTNDMLDYLLIQNKELLKDHLLDLFFINDLKLSPNISTRIINFIKQNKPTTVEGNLQFWIKKIKHETDEVRLKALLYLKQYLSKSRNEINDLILSDINVDPLIVELLDALMSRCQDKDEAIRIASGDCIGELGAIEPSLLPRRIISRGDSNFIFDMNQDFAYALFFELVGLYHSQKSTQSMDCFSLAIQEILRTYEISPEGRNKKLWKDLSPKIQRMVTPLLTSHYTIMTSTDIEHSGPIYGSDLGSTFELWIFNWTISMLKSIKESNINTVLRACRPAFKRNIKIITFCIPYIVAHIIMNGSNEDVEKVKSEMLAVIETNTQTQVDKELARHRPLRAPVDQTSNGSKRVSDEARRVRCLQVLFSCLDYLLRWLRERRKTRDSTYEKIKNFCNSFSKLVLAKRCYQSGEYHRALIYLEQHMSFSKKGLSEITEGGLLAKIYTQLEEPDGVTGILVGQDKCPTLQQLVLAHQVNGQFQDAATCFERLLHNPTIKVQYLRGMIQCYLDLDQPFTAMNITKGVLEDRPELETLICDREPFWQLAHFGKIGSESGNNVKLDLQTDLKNHVKPDLFEVKKELVSMLTASSRPRAYEQSYSYIMKLHVVNEFEKACTMMLENMDCLPTIFEEWGLRDKLVNASRGAEFILEMRRAILDLAAQLQSETNTGKTLITEEIGKLWLKSAKIARKAGMHQQAYMYILSATDSCPPQDLCIEQAQLYWEKGSHEDALITLKRCLATYFKTVAEYKERPNEFTIERRKCAKAKLLWAKYNDETLNVEANNNMHNYKEAFEVWRGWEKSCLSVARYFESVLDKMSDEERMGQSGRDMQTHIINYYGKSLMCGCKYIHQSLPRMLTIWLNYASRARTHSHSDSGVSKALAQMTKIVETYIVRVPTFVWLTAFSQLVSRICHPNKDVKNTLFMLIVRLIKAYPQHCLWMMASVFNSSYTARQRSCKEILNHETLKTPSMLKLIQHFHRLWEKLVELSNKTIPDGMSTTTVPVLSRSLPKLLAEKDFGPVMMPTSKFRQLHLPMKGAKPEQHNPFADNWVSIIGIEEQVVVMPSLQRPRRIALRGSDGRSYLFMCKPKDDLRRDFRLMEFNDIVNKYLQKDPESRRRRLYIRTYSVVPLNEECGLIEWVPNLIGYRHILMNMYKERNMLTTAKEIKSMTCALKDDLAKKRQNFLEKLLPRHPPVLGDWFQFAFPDPYGWYEARIAYIRTAAVMSMVGYILGLGDRHGENILIDSKCGDCVHVDFNCLFNRGETLEWPERVPFRLTQNMVEAMGPLKYEGPFRQSCRTTMKVLREQTNTLISVLKPFVYDPLVSWNRNQLNDTGEKTNEKAVENIKNIEDRLKGMVGSRTKKLEALTLYLSVEGQVNHLILDAINVDNLCQMYIGWGAYL
ncbi:hypothetical protein TKK_0012398 [Trichogramma kaykai]